MLIDTGSMVTMTEANQNFSRVARKVDEYGSAVVFKNNRPRYLIIDFNLAGEAEAATDSEVLAASKALIAKNRAAYEELAR